MENQISIREALEENDIELFWKQLYCYYKEDIFPYPNSEDREYFLSDEYREAMMSLHEKSQDRCYYLFFQQDGKDIGFALPMIYNSEDKRCFIMEYSIYPEYRGKGIGKKCASIMLNWAKENGALYAELNYGGDDRRLRFWKSVGFIENGIDEWGNPLMIIPPLGEVPFSVEILDNPADWQLLKLENGYKKEIGEELLTEEKQQELQKAIKDRKITFFIAKRNSRAVGMCSITRYYSTFSCSDIGVFEDFYIEPAFRGKGIARKLVQTAQAWCKNNLLSSLTVCCAPCDEKMYQKLGFKLRIGTTFAYTTE